MPNHRCQNPGKDNPNLEPAGTRLDKTQKPLLVAQYIISNQARTKNILRSASGEHTRRTNFFKTILLEDKGSRYPASMENSLHTSSNANTNRENRMNKKQIDWSGERVTLPHYLRKTPKRILVNGVWKPALPPLSWWERIQLWILCTFTES